MYWAQRKAAREAFAHPPCGYFDADDERDGAGKILNDEEYARALHTRDDIFKIDNEVFLHIVQGSALLLAALAGIWLSTRSSPIDAASDFFEPIRAERIATLWRHSEWTDSAQAAVTPRHYVRIRTVSPRAAVGLDFLRLEKEATRRSPFAVSEDAFIDTAGHAGDSDIDSRRHVPDVSSNDTWDSSQKATAPEAVVDKDPGSDDPLYAFRRALEQNPRDADALAGIGDHFYHTGLLDSAAPYYNRALAENPENRSAWNNIGSVHYYRSSMADNVNYRRRRGIRDRAHYKRVLYDSATAAYTRAFSLDSSFVEALANRAVVHDIYGNHDQAMLDYTLAIRIDSAYANAYRKRAGMHKRSGKHEKAIEDYTAAIRLDSSSYRYNPTLNYANAYFGRGVTYFKMGRYGDAVADFDSTLAVYPRHSLAILNKGISLGSLGRYEEAIDLLGMAVERISPAEYDGARMLGFMHRGNAFKALGMYEKAIADYERAKELSRLAARACWRIAQCHSLQKDYDSAILWLNKSISHGFSDFHLWRRDRELAPLWNTSEFLELFQ